MPRNYSFKINGSQSFDGVTASSKSQLEALHICVRTGVIANIQENSSDMAMVTALLQIPFEDSQRLCSLLMTDKVQDESARPLGENLFADNIQDYYLVLAYVIKENLGNFWKLRRQRERGAKEAEQQG